MKNVDFEVREVGKTLELVINKLPQALFDTMGSDGHTHNTGGSFPYPGFSVQLQESDEPYIRFEDSLITIAGKRGVPFTPQVAPYYKEPEWIMGLSQEARKPMQFSDPKELRERATQAREAFSRFLDDYPFPKSHL